MTDITTHLNLRVPPIAIGFLSEIPDNLPAWNGAEQPAGCSFWKEAQAGRAFYTLPKDHYNCAVGAYTHKIELPMDRADELMGTIGFMVENAYLRMDEVPGIPTLPATPAAIAYAPADAAPFAPSVVVVAGSPASMMVLYEAALAAKVTGALIPTLGRPGCAALPLALGSDAAALSMGCKGNRTFTGLPDSELYMSIPGDVWPRVVDALSAISSANDSMGAYYTDKKARFDSAAPAA